MNNKLKTQAVEQLFQAILSLKDLDEAYDFFEDVCTINEILSLSQRFEVAKMLREHRTYLDIAEKTGASTATISRVNRSLNYGNDGYDRVFERLGMLEKESEDNMKQCKRELSVLAVPLIYMDYFFLSVLSGFSGCFGACLAE